MGAFIGLVALFGCYGSHQQSQVILFFVSFQLLYLIYKDFLVSKSVRIHHINTILNFEFMYSAVCGTYCIISEMIIVT